MIAIKGIHYYIKLDTDKGIFLNNIPEKKLLENAKEKSLCSRMICITKNI